MLAFFQLLVGQAFVGKEGNEPQQTAKKEEVEEEVVPEAEPEVAPDDIPF